MSRAQLLSSGSTRIETGITLIEASAGTGKTFAISMHVLRAVVELQIGVEQILVVTFTVAATEELKNRIRLRLLEARNILREVDGTYDDELVQWASSIKDGKKAIQLIETSLLDIDRIGVYTIHSFCQRMLHEQPLESGQLFDIELVDDLQLVTDGVVKDWWRKNLYRLNPKIAALLLEIYPDPYSLYMSVREAEDPLAAVLPEQQSNSASCSEVERCFERLKTWWQKKGALLSARFDDASANGYLNKDLNTNYAHWLRTLANMVANEAPPQRHLVEWLANDTLISGLNGKRLRGVEKKQHYIASWPLPGSIIVDYISAVDNLILQFRLNLTHELRSTVPLRLRESGRMSFNDLVIMLASALTSGSGKALRQMIRKRYDIILIDEFQDTDSAQWNIFRTLFHSGRHTLYLIGDPKQAIYRFRGADIHSYFEAREAAHRNFTLHRNFRSHPELVTAINQLLKNVNFSGIGYSMVEPGLRIESSRLIDNETTWKPLICCQLENHSELDVSWSGGAAHERIRKWVVAEIVRLITLDSTVKIEEGDHQGSQIHRPVEPADIAILVRTHNQAQHYQEELSAHSIPSIVASKTSIFSTEECQQLLLVISAVATPSTIQLKAALSCDWFGLREDAFKEMKRDEAQLDKWSARFQYYNRLWQETGFLPMLMALLRTEKVFVQLSSLPRGERRIANIQHCSELIQEQVQQEGYSPQQTVAWLQNMMVKDAGLKDTELRLESDSDAVRIVTIHSSKGLEFPVTFCPYLMASSNVSAGVRTSVKCHDSNGRLLVDLGSEYFMDHARLAQQEDDQEELRLAYVAITRARLRCYLFWADIKGWGKNPGSFESSLGKVLFPEGGCDFISQKNRLRARAQEGCFSHAIISQDHVQADVYLPRETKERVLQARLRGNRSLSTSRSLTSFSNLVSSSSYRDTTLSKAFDEKEVVVTENQNISLPGGVRLGNVVHDALELLSFSEIASQSYDDEILYRLCQRYNLDAEITHLKTLLRNSVTTDLSAPAESMISFTLADVPPENQVKELNFSLHITPTTTNDLNRILATQQTYTPLHFRELDGFINGFIDLVCLYDGRYYVIDYKTNNLGEHREDYAGEALTSAMQSHNYGLQYWLYTIVVHRFLKRWLSDYSYQVHFGGVMYLFVRGMNPAYKGSGVFYSLPEEHLVEALDRCFK